MNQSELYRYEGAAIELCYRLNTNPHEQLMDANGYYHPAWMKQAEKMREAHLMLEVMRQFGLM